LKYSVDDSESLFGRFIFRNGLAPNYKSSQMQELTWRVRNLGNFLGKKIKENHQSVKIGLI
jgi:hypothetical protein